MIQPVVSALHARRPGITEDLLAPAYDEQGRNPYGWLAELLPAGPVLDLGCGSAALADHVECYLGVDSSTAELAAAAVRRPSAATVLGDALTVDLGGRTFDAVALSMALMLLPLELLLGRARGWLAPGAALAATVPIRSSHLAGTAYNRLLTTLGWQGEPFPEPLDRLAERAAGQGFAVVSDELRSFAVPIVRLPDRELLLRSFYLPDRGADSLPAPGNCSWPRWLPESRRSATPSGGLACACPEPAAGEP